MDEKAVILENATKVLLQDSKSEALSIITKNYQFKV